MNLGGGNAELMLAWAEGCTLVPPGVRAEEAAPIFCAGYTVMSALRRASLRSGDRVAVLGIGGLGHMALQCAKALGHATVAVTSTESKRRDAGALGADEVVIFSDDPGAALRDAGGADVILSTSNSAVHLSKAMAGLRIEGRLVNVGAVDGPIEVNAVPQFMMQTSLLGSTMGNRRDLLDVLALFAAGKVRPMVETYPLDQVNDVRDRLEAGKVRYRAVLLLQ